MNTLPLNELLQREVNRREFLLYLGLILITVTGIAGVLKSLTSLSQSKAEKGFGSKPYGM